MSAFGVMSPRRAALRWMSHQCGVDSLITLGEKRRAELRIAQMTLDSFPAVVREMWIDYDHARALAMNEHLEALRRFLAGEQRRFEKLEAVK